MLRHRLTYGPLLILLLAALLALDAWIDGLEVPGLRAVTGRDTPPPGVVVFLVVTAVSFLATREMAAILIANGIKASKRVMCAASLLGLAVSCFIPGHAPPLDAAAAVSTAAILVLLGALAFHARHRSVEGVVAAAGGTLLAFVYLGLMFGFLLAIRRDHSVMVLGWVILVTKACDIGAYFTGKTIGRHKMIPWLSPGKTWEGLAGGVAASSLVGAGGVWLLQRLGDESLPGVASAAVASALFGLIGQAGDLIESLFKRDAGMKDAGSSLPGFGGLLDVLDSPLLVAPAAYWWLTVFGNSGATGAATL